jgi:hypothetical protein
LHFSGIVQGATGAVDKFASGDIMGGLLDLTQASVNAWRFSQACFAAGTPLLTPQGSKAIEQLQVGDLVLARSEYDLEVAGLMQDCGDCGQLTLVRRGACCNCDTCGASVGCS